MPIPAQPAVDRLFALAHTWSAMANGRLAVEALLDINGPYPVEPPDDAPQSEVGAWIDAIAARERSDDALLEAAGVRPGVIAHQLAGVVAEFREILGRRPEYDDVDDWPAEIRQVLTETLGADPEWVRRAWDAY